MGKVYSKPSIRPVGDPVSPNGCTFVAGVVALVVALVGGAVAAAAAVGAANVGAAGNFVWFVNVGAYVNATSSC